MNQGLQDVLKTLWVGLCFLTLVAGCGDENSEIGVEQESAGASQADEPRITTPSAAKSVEQESAGVPQAEEPRNTTASAAKPVEQESAGVPQAGEPRIATTSVGVPKVEFPEKHRAFFKAHCLDCHDSETREGKVDLETLPFRITTSEQAELWQKVLGALNSGEMPPERLRQPGNREKADFLDDLSLTMVTARKVLSDSGGKITMRRLNKRDYQNSIESLLGVRLGKELLPDDGSSGDFDTVGASLFLSSDKFEQYLKLGRHAIDEFYERRAARNARPFVYRVEPEKNAQCRFETGSQTK